ncbi:MAG: hypothetical protein ACETVP_02265 [Candidatus Bathyarchaeia archaeon]
MAKKSILAFDDALQDVAWKPSASRMARFKVEYGALKLIPNTLTLNVSARIGDSSENHTVGSVSTGLIRYSIGTRYVTLGENHTSYILGDDSLVVTGSTESLGRVLIEQGSGLVDVTLSYRARVIRTSVIEVNGTMVNYVTVWLVEVVTVEAYPTTHIHSFDLRARCVSIKTNTVGPYDVTGAEYCTITVESKGESSSAQVGLVAGKVVFNVVVAEVKVSL